MNLIAYSSWSSLLQVSYVSVLLNQCGLDELIPDLSKKNTHEEEEFRMDICDLSNIWSLQSCSLSPSLSHTHSFLSSSSTCSVLTLAHWSRRDSFWLLLIDWSISEEEYASVYPWERLRDAWLTEAGLEERLLTNLLDLVWWRESFCGRHTRVKICFSNTNWSKHLF